MTTSTELVTNLRDPDTWTVLAVAAGAGAIGGFTHWLGAVAGVITPDPDDAATKTVTRVAAEIMVGAAAAVIMLFVVKPADGFGMIASSIMTGLFGRAVISALRARAQVEIIDKARGAAQAAAATAGRDAAALAEHVDALLQVTPDAVGDALMKSSTATPPPVAASVRAAAARALASFRARTT
ncbi:MAG: hypothetical protein IPL61_26625 [Myxococcales bacterium]|nr:hypothetical protein [Myxococcales bacterium]